MPSFLMWPFAIIAAIILFSLAVFIHELGHFIAARLLGLKADVFSIGFGPALWKKTIRGTEIRISAIPFGGYVSLPQLDPEGMSKLQGEHAEVLPPAAPWKRIIVAFAGPLGNIFLAFICASLISCYAPDETVGASTTIGFIDETSPAWEAGLRKGDTLVAVNDVSVATWDNFNQECYLAGSKDTPVKVDVRKKDGSMVQIVLPLTREVSEKDDVYGVDGIIQDPVYYYAEYVQPGSPAASAGITKNDVVRLLNIQDGNATFEVLVGLTGETKTVTLPLPQSQGLKFDEVIPTGMFKDLQSGDILLQINEYPIRHWFDFDNVLDTFEDGAPLSFTLLRNGMQLTVSTLFSTEDKAQRTSYLLSYPYFFGVTEVIPASPAERAGIKAGDKILEVNNIPFRQPEMLTDAVNNTLVMKLQTDEEAPRTLELTRGPIQREDGVIPKRLYFGLYTAALSINHLYSIVVEQMHPNPEARQELYLLGAIGIIPKPFYQPKQWMWMAHRGIYEQLEGDVANVVRVFKALLTPKGEKEAGRAAKGLGGPLMIFTILMKLVQHGLWVSLGFMRLICMNLAILNLLPLPVLDGGHILFALYAMIRRKEPSVKVVGIITTCFAFLLIGLMLWFLFSDIMRFI